jgi:hypothetical protein
VTRIELTLTTLRDYIDFYVKEDVGYFIIVDNTVCRLKANQQLCFNILNSKIDNLLQKMDTI